MSRKRPIIEILWDIETTEVDPCLGEITYIGYWKLDDDEPVLIKCDSEKDGIINFLVHLLNILTENRECNIRFIGWRSLSFDFVWMLVKAIQYEIDIRIFLKCQHLDLSHLLSGLDITSRRLEYTLFNKYQSSPSEVMPMAWSKKDYDLIEKHLKDDLSLMKELYRRIKLCGVYPLVAKLVRIPWMG